MPGPILTSKVSLLNEHETMRLIGLVEAIDKRLNARSETDAKLAELKRTVAPGAVLDRL